MLTVCHFAIYYQQSRMKSFVIRLYMLDVLCRCEAWSVTLREEYRLRAFEDSVLRISGPKRDKATGEN
jgi:hypothetical protein